MKKILLCYGDLFKESGFSLRIKNEISLLDKNLLEEVSLISFSHNIYHRSSFFKNIKEFFVLKRHIFPPLFILDLVKTILLIKKILEENNGTVLLYAHNLYSSFIAIFFKLWKKNAKVIFDVHGLVPQEFVWLKKGKRWGLAYFMLKIIERICAMKSDYLVFASQSLEEYFKKRYKINKKIAVIPNISPFPIRDMSELNRIRADLKKKFNLEDSTVLLHVGSFLQWTDADMVIEIIKRLKKFIPKVFLVILTYDEKTEVTNFLIGNQMLQSQFCVMHVPHDKIHQFIPVGDLGLIIRDNSLINEVAFPTKFSEYLACGVPILSTDSIKDIVNNIKIYNLGFVLSNNEWDLDTIKQLQDKKDIEKKRYQCVTYFTQELESITKKFHNIFLHLTSKADS